MVWQNRVVVMLAARSRLVVCESSLHATHHHALLLGPRAGCVCSPCTPPCPLQVHAVETVGLVGRSEQCDHPRVRACSSALPHRSLVCRVPPHMRNMDLPLTMPLCCFFDLPVSCFVGASVRTAHCANMYPAGPADLPGLTAARASVELALGAWLQK
jgi:hypothetical protein